MRQCNLWKGIAVTIPDEPVSLYVLAIIYAGDVVFAVSGALTAGRHRMDILGFALIGTITGIGGGTVRDLLLGRTVWWTQHPAELLLCVAAALATYFLVKNDITRQKAMIWSDALGLAAFGVLGCHVALTFGAPYPRGQGRRRSSCVGRSHLRDGHAGIRRNHHAAGESLLTFG